ncbi:MAG: pyridoxal phosphate enzyme (YggS family) [Marivirga sp.]|jgi:pyridoxal phosphate enzyme (YggS family)
MDIVNNISAIQKDLKQVKLIAVSKTKPNEMLEAAYAGGQRAFGENKVQEMSDKADSLPKDMEWHMIGHLQRNKVKYIVPYVHLIHGVDSPRLLVEINKQGKKIDRIIPVLLQMHIAEEDTKFGLDQQELEELLGSESFKEMGNVAIQGLMGMATFTDDKDKVRREFKALKKTFDFVRDKYSGDNLDMQELSMGMSGDYQIAVEEGSTMVRIGSAIFGGRN